jgi:hypothetical protein
MGDFGKRGLRVALAWACAAMSFGALRGAHPGLSSYSFPLHPPTYFRCSSTGPTAYFRTFQRTQPHDRQVHRTRARHPEKKSKSEGRCGSYRAGGERGDSQIPTSAQALLLTSTHSNVFCHTGLYQFKFKLGLSSPPMPTLMQKH